MGFPAGSAVKNQPAMQETQETQVLSLGGKYLPEECSPICKWAKDSFWEIIREEFWTFVDTELFSIKEGQERRAVVNTLGGRQSTESVL